MDYTLKNIYRYKPDQGLQMAEDMLVMEREYNLYVEGIPKKTIYCTPSHVDELVVGNLTLEQVVVGPECIRELLITPGKIEVYLQPLENSSPPPVSSELTVAADAIEQLMEKHLQNSKLHRLTGGVHSMSLGYDAQLLVSREDIGRHNAVDKIFGFCLKEKLNCSEYVFLSSGRITHEIINKLKFMGVRLAVSRAAVSDLACEVADQAGITVCGFSRGHGFNIYTHYHRIRAR